MRTLRTRVLIVTILLLLLSFAATFIVSQTIIEQGFLNLEQRATVETLHRAQTALGEQITYLGNTTRDYAHWDDTFAFVQSGNMGYIDANFQAYTYESFELDLVVFLNSNQEVAYVGGFDPEQGLAIDVPSDFILQLLSTRDVFAHTDGLDIIAGLIPTEQNILMIGSVQILPSNLEGEPAGTLIFGRYLESDELEELSASVGNELAVFDLTKSALPADIIRAKDLTPSADSSITVPLNASVLHSYVYLADISEVPNFLLRVTMSRDIYLEGITTRGYFIGAILVIGLFLVALTLLMLDRLILFRLTTLGRRIREIAPDNQQRLIPFEGNDEIAQVAQQFNRLLQDINRYDASLDHLNQELKDTNAELRAEQENKDRFFSHLGHELRTPLSNIKLRLYVLKRQPERAVESVNMLTQLVDQITALIEDMVEMSRMSRGSIKIERFRIDLYPLIRTVVKSVEPYATDKSNRITLRCDAASSDIEGDADRLKIALGNLVRFCLRSSEPKSEIQIQLFDMSTGDRQWIATRIDWRSTDPRVADLHNLVTPFFVPTESDKTGTQMHLALAKITIDMHMGKIRLETDGDDRKTLIIMLPSLEQPAVVQSPRLQFNS